ncbi:MAG TPA: sigma-54 dependent transcriptional regulator [Acidobacteriaceae bacterium]|nr:sigma-54 dependent transcriptional regulator [Acidobacteriaceae bacterium]
MQSQKIVEVRGSVSRTALLVSADTSFRQRLAETLTGMRWKVREASGGAEALCYLEETVSEALLLDSWLPDLEAGDLAEQLRIQYPSLDLICVDETEETPGHARSVRRHELLYALRRAQTNEGPIVISMETPRESLLHRIAPRGIRSPHVHGINPAGSFLNRKAEEMPAEVPLAVLDNPLEEISKKIESLPGETLSAVNALRKNIAAPTATEIPGLLGKSAKMQALAQFIRLVAPRKTTVLIEGPTGSGKELVARALHQLSPRANRPFIVVNCAAIPEALLEAELFGHTRGAFTGAVQARTGRMEAAHGGTLFLDEIGEMPLALQAKVLRFLEAGELQRIGENQPTRVDVRILAATHQPLVQHVAEGKFRADLYFRLAVFPMQTPSLAERAEDIPSLAEHFLAQLGKDAPAKVFDPVALEKLTAHGWPGNVRELAHVVERAYILAEDRTEITAGEIYFT